MKNKILISLTSVFLVGIFLLGSLSIMAEFGDSNDPLVTKSYIDGVLTLEVNDKINNAIAKSLEDNKKYTDDALLNHKSAVDAKIEQLKNGGITIDQNTVNSIADKVINELKAEGISSSPAWKVVVLEKHQVINGTKGTEILLRDGSATCFSTGNIGIINLTDGTELSPTKAVAKNKLYLVSIDNRGIKAGTGGATVLVSGDYTLQ